MSRTRIPDALYVFGKEIPIEYEDKLLNSKGEELDGDTDGSVIRISSQAKKKEHLSILLHEAVHCLVRRTGMYYREDWDTNLEEQLAENLTVMIMENFILRSKH